MANKVFTARASGLEMRVTYNTETRAITKREVFEVADREAGKLDLRSLPKADKIRMADKIDAAIVLFESKPAPKAKAVPKGKTTSKSTVIETAAKKPVAKTKPVKDEYLEGIKNRKPAAKKSSAEVTKRGKQVAKPVEDKKSAKTSASVKASANQKAWGKAVELTIAENKEFDKRAIAVFKNIGNKHGLRYEQVKGGIYLFGAELNCYRAYYVLRENYKMEIRVGYSKNMKCHFVSYDLKG